MKCHDNLASKNEIIFFVKDKLKAIIIAEREFFNVIGQYTILST